MVWLTDGAAAGRLAGFCRGLCRGLVVRVRLFSRRSLLGRLRLSGRRQDIRMAAAVRGDRRCPRVLRSSPASDWRSRASRGRAGPWRILALAASLTAAEWLRGHVLSGFPWNAFGYALTGPLVLAQAAAVIGLWGLTFLAIAIFASPGRAGRCPAETQRPFRCLLASALVALASLACMARCGCRARRRHSSTACGCASCSPTCSRMNKFNYARQAAT